MGGPTVAVVADNDRDGDNGSPPSSAADEISTPVDIEGAMAGVDAMWERMKLREPPPRQPARQPPANKPALKPPPPGASRAEVKAYRAAIRAAAVENIGRERAQIAAAMQNAQKAIAERDVVHYELT